MKSTEFKNVVREIILEMITEVDDSINKKIDEFGELSNEMDRVKKQLEDLKRKYSAIEDELRPVMEELKKNKQKFLETEKYLIAIKKSGYDKTTFAYKDAFDTALTKVNGQTKKLLQELLETTKKVTPIATSIGVQTKEGFVSDLLKKMKGFFSKLIPSFMKTNKSLDELQSIAKKMIK